MAHIKAIYRYPIKGLSPEPLAGATLAPGQTVPGDRLYAIENGPSPFDPVKQPYLRKTHFLMLMKNERLARLRCTFDQDTHVLAIEPPPAAGAPAGGSSSGRMVRGDLRTAEGRAAIENFFAVFCADELRGPPRVLHAPGHSFSDMDKKVISIINLASLAALEGMVGAAVDPLRFRANLYVDSWPAWSELDLVGREMTLGGSVRVKVIKRIIRCAATNVDPTTAARDLNVPQTLMRELGHADCGVYAEVLDGGEINERDRIELS